MSSNPPRPTTALVLHPTADDHRRRIDSLRHELAGLIGEYIDLQFTELPSLRNRYDKLFGADERRIQERTLDLSQRKRMVELFALKLDRGESLDAEMVALVMKAVASEFGILRSRVARATRSSRDNGSYAGMNEQRASGSQASTGHPANLRDLYRRLARRFHPDARRHGNDSGHYWHLLQHAYRRGDVSLLRALAHLIGDVDRGEASSLSLLEREEGRLHAAIAAQRNRNESLTNSEPFTLRDLIDSDDWRKLRRASLDEELGAVEARLEKCNRFLDPILATAERSSPPTIVRDVWSNFVEEMYINRR